MTSPARKAAHTPHPNPRAGQMEPSPGQSVVLRYLHRYSQLRGWMPTRAEIVHELRGSSTNAAQDHLLALEAKGFVEIGPNVARGIRFTAHGLAWLEAERRKAGKR